jgi:diguanylate cyclase (GGDEF)-like protein
LKNPLRGLLTQYVNMAVLLSLIASVLIVYFFVGALNRHAVKTDAELIQGGVDFVVARTEAFARDYGWWREALEAFETTDINWMYRNMGSSIETPRAFDILVVAEEADGKIFGWDENNPDTPRPDIFTPAQLADIRDDLATAHALGRYSTSHMMYIDGRPFIISATLMGENPDRSAYSPLDDPMMIIGEELDFVFLTNIGNLFDVRDLQFGQYDTNAANSLALTDSAGHHLAYLVWQPTVPGTHALRMTFLPLISYIAVFLIFAIFIGRRANRLASTAVEGERRATLASKTDCMTGLANRQGFADFVDRPCAEFSAAQGQAAVIFIDLNGFKQINDDAGHKIGDRVLKIVSQRFVNAVRDKAFLARMGGDEFACVLIGSDAEGDADIIARRLIFSLEEPLKIEGSFYQVGAAVGIASSTGNDLQTFPALLHNADVAMYRAKADQLAEPLHYDAKLEEEHQYQRDLCEEMHAGLERGEFSVHYQPIVRASDKSLASVEALLRWTSPTRGSVGPDEFIPIAERTSLIQRLGAFVLKTVCEEIGPDAGFSVAINLSPAQLRDPELCQTFINILDAHNMKPSAIEVELTEGLLVDNLGKAKIRLQQFVDAGFKVNLDDFGTGFASLGYLNEFPFSKIKIDRSYISKCGEDPKVSQTLQAFALLTQSLDLEVVAEGVETEMQSKLIHMLGFDYLQGWHFGRPVPAQKFWAAHGGGATPRASDRSPN